MKTEVNVYNGYVDLDSILDIKLSIMLKYFPLLTTRFLETGDYFRREKDVFKHKDVHYEVHEDLVEILYKSRSKEDLKLALPTSIPIVISSGLDDLADNSDPREVVRDYTFYINTYPFLLSESEQFNIAKMFKQFFFVPFEVIMIYEPDCNINPTWLSTNNISLFVKYNFLEWLEKTNKEDLFKNLLVDLKVLTPRLSNGVYAEGFENNVWENLSKALELFMKVEFLDYTAYSPVSLLKAYNEFETKKNDQ